MDHQGIVEHIGRLTPVGVGRQPAIGDDQCRRVIGLRSGPILQHVFVKDFARDIVFDSRIAIGNEVHVHAEQRTALCHHQHVFRTGGGDDLLALFTPRLIVVLDRNTALRLDPLDVRQRILVTVDAGINAGGLGPVHDFRSRKDTRCQHVAGLLPLRGGEDHAGAGRRIVDRGRTHRQVLDERPVLLRHQVAHTLRTMRMGIHQPRHDGLARSVDHRRALRYLDGRGWTYRGNPVADDDDGAIGNLARTVARHREDLRTRDRHGCARLVRADRTLKRRASGRRHELRCVLVLRCAGEHRCQAGAIENGSHRPGQHIAAFGPPDIIRSAFGCAHDR